MQKLSRSKLARFIADGIEAGKSKQSIKQVAAYLMESRRIKEADLLTRAVYQELERRGVVVANLSSAYALDESIEKTLKSLLDAKKLYLTTKVEPELLGGIKVETATRSLDGTIKRRLEQLRESKI